MFAYLFVYLFVFFSFLNGESIFVYSIVGIFVHKVLHMCKSVHICNCLFGCAFKGLFVCSHASVSSLMYVSVG